VGVRASDSRRAAGIADLGLTLTRLIRIVAAVVTGIIVLAIVFVMLGANHGNEIVSQVLDWAGSLAGPFTDIFTLHSARASTALNYGIAAIVYALLAELIANLITTAFDPARRRAVW
jgi:Na+-transporting NADH:ubiquinone oxidoreductase subunit NqrB